MVPGHRAPAGPLTGLTGPTGDWEGAPLEGILDQFRERLPGVTAADVIALAVATIDVDTAAAAIAPPGRPAPADTLLGARGVTSSVASGRTLLLLEPATEGRLAAFLARHGEGLAAIYVRSRSKAWLDRGPLGRPGATALGRPGRLVAGERLGDAVIVLVP